MPTLIKNISSSIIDTFIGDIYLFKKIDANIGYGDYMYLYNIEAFLQNYERIEYTEELIKPLNFGLKVNSDIITLEISY